MAEGEARGARVRVHRALPSHAGLGSGTQLALAIGRAVSALHDVEVDADWLERLADEHGPPPAEVEDPLEPEDILDASLRCPTFAAARFGAA